MQLALPSLPQISLIWRSHSKHGSRPPNMVAALQIWQVALPSLLRISRSAKPDTQAPALDALSILAELPQVCDPTPTALHQRSTRPPALTRPSPTLRPPSTRPKYVPNQLPDQLHLSPRGQSVVSNRPHPTLTHSSPPPPPTPTHAHSQAPSGCPKWMPQVGPP